MARSHGMSGTPTWHSWTGMLARCRDLNHASYKYYGARGIRVCERWKSFANFVADMGAKPPGMSIERIDTNRDYEPSNCRWLPLREQSRNRRYCIKITISGETKCLKEWARARGVPYLTVYGRLKRGFAPDVALTRGEIGL